MAGYYGCGGPEGMAGSVIRDLDQMGNLGAVFSLAYDRGGKVINMIENRLGTERFFAFMQKVYHDHAWKTLSLRGVPAELIAFDASTDWNDFLNGWLIEHRDLDWSVEAVDVGTSGEWEPRLPGQDPAQAERDAGRADRRPLQGRRLGASGPDLARPRVLRRPRCPRRASGRHLGRLGPVARAYRPRSRSTPSTPCSTPFPRTTAGSPRWPGE